MNKIDPKKRIIKLRNWLNEWNYKYFVENNHKIEEGVRDQLKRELEDLEKQYPELITPDSPTQRVGSVLSGRFPKIKHLTTKESLADVFTLTELEEWEKRLKRILTSPKKFEFLSELKLDGLNITVIYKNGKFLRAITRGNGIEGEDVSQNIKTIESVPLELRHTDYQLPEIIEVSGEVFMSKKSFDELNSLDNNNFKNTRNAAAGTVRQLNPQIVANRNLSFFFYSINRDTIEKSGIKTQQELLNLLNNLGLPTDQHSNYCQNISEIETFITKWQKNRDTLPYEIDGVVVKVNNLNEQRELGSTAKAPRYAVAYKFPAMQATSQILAINLQVGRTGAITPVAIMKPTLLAGSTVARATLHNDEEIARKDIRVGDTVIIQKAGDVIPEVVEVLKNLRSGKEKIFVMPQKCPACEAEIIKPEGEAIYRCFNPDCYAKNQVQIGFFVSKNAFNIDGLGKKVVEQLFSKGIIEDAADIFLLKKENLMGIELFKDKRSDNLIEAINKAKLIEIKNFIYALGIRYIGMETAELIAKNLDLPVHHVKITKVHEEEQLDLFNGLQSRSEDYSVAQISDLILKITDWSLEDLENIEGVGIKVAESIYFWFREKRNLGFLQKLEDAGIKLLFNPGAIVEATLVGLTFVITGSLNSMGREDAKKKIKERGGKISSQISNKTDYLVVGDNPGSKLLKAKKLEVKILREKEFIQKLSS